MFLFYQFNTLSSSLLGSQIKKRAEKSGGRGIGVLCLSEFTKQKKPGRFSSFFSFLLPAFNTNLLTENEKITQRLLYFIYFKFSLLVDRPQGQSLIRRLLSQHGDQGELSWIKYWMEHFSKCVPLRDSRKRVSWSHEFSPINNTEVLRSTAGKESKQF